MGTKDFVYVALIGLTAMFLFPLWLPSAQNHRPQRRKLNVPYNDSGCLTELPPDAAEESSLDYGERVNAIPHLTPAEIRAVFGDTKRALPHPGQHRTART